MIRLLSDVPIEQLFIGIHKSISNELKDYKSLSDIDPERLAEQIAESRKIPLTTLNKDQMEIEPEMRSKSGKSYPLSYDVDRNKNYPNAFVIYTIPFSGGGDEIFRVTPKRFGRRTVGAELLGKKIQFAVDAQYATLDLTEEKKLAVKQEADKIISFIENSLSQINEEIEEFNSNLKSFVVAEVNKEITEEEDMNKLKDDLRP